MFKYSHTEKTAQLKLHDKLQAQYLPILGASLINVFLCHSYIVRKTPYILRAPTSEGVIPNLGYIKKGGRSLFM